MGRDFTKPDISKVTRDLTGKTLFIWGTNRTGKTYQTTRLPKPCYLMFEAGLGGRSNVPNFPMNKWSDYVEFVKWASSDPKKARELYQTIILDEISVMGRMCGDYICQKNGVATLDEVAFGKLYKQLAAEFERNMSLLTKCGFTVVAIGHDGGTKKTKDPLTGAEREIEFPAGDKRIVELICNLFDIIAFAYLNGVDEKGVPRNSSLYMGSRGFCHAGSRYTHLQEILENFTAENLVAAVGAAIEKEEAATGIASPTFDEYQEQLQQPQEKPFAQLREEIQAIAMTMFNEETGEMDEKYTAIVETYLGKGKKVCDSTPEQQQLLSLVLYDLQMLGAE